MADEIATPIIIPEGLNLFHYVNGELAKFLEILSKTQVYLDDWDQLPQQAKDIAKDRIINFINANGQLLVNVKEYVSGL